MSGRSHVDVSERRLRPIYDCLDNSNNKKALHEADKVLKKQKDFLCAKVLKALALLRLGRHDEAYSLLQEVHKQSPTDEPSMQAMCICYREMHRLDLIADMYANAAKAAPDNEEILSSLFMAYVRLGDYKKQQQTAMALHRLRPLKNPYYFWAIMSILMQANTSEERLAKAMFLPLAERMTKKYADEDKIDAEAEVQMYLIILDSMGKYESELEVINGKLGDKLVTELNFKETRCAELYVKLGKWAQANASYRKLLKKEPDHWKYYVEYFKSLFALIDSEWSPGNQDSSESDAEDKVDHSVDLARQFLEEQLVLAKEAARPVRGAYLAQLELIRQLRQRKSGNWREIGNPCEMLKQYYKLFGSKLCFFSDIKLYVSLIDESEGDQLIQALLMEAGFTSDDGEIVLAKNPKHLQSHMSVLQVAHHSGLNDKLNEEGKMSLIKDLLHRYTEGLSMGDDLLSTDLQYCDSYMTLAVHVMYDMWEKTGNNSLIWQGLQLLEKALRKSPSNFQFKLLLIRFYCTLGAFGPCPALYESMEIKHIQNDALGYVIANHISRLGHWASAGALYDVMLRFFTVNQKDTSEYLISSYKYGSFTKVNEFVKFRERLQRSIQYASATAERLLLDMVMETENHQRTEQILRYLEIDPEKDNTNWEELRDNRDFNVVQNWAPAERGFNNDLQEDSFQEECAWLRIRNLLVRSLAGAVQLGMETGQNNMNGSNGDEQKKSPVNVLVDLISQFKSHLDSCRQDFSEPKNYSLSGPYRTPISTYLKLDLSSILNDLMDLVLYSYKLSTEGFDKADEKTESDLRTKIVNKLKDVIEKHKAGPVTMDGERLKFHPDVLEGLVLISECYAHVVMLVGVCNKLVLPAKASAGKKNKKKKETTEKPKTHEAINTLVAELCTVGDSVLAAFRNVDLASLSFSMASLRVSDDPVIVEPEESEENEIWSKMEASFKQSSEEHCTFLQLKKCYLSTLKL